MGPVHRVSQWCLQVVHYQCIWGEGGGGGTCLTFLLNFHGNTYFGDGFNPRPFTISISLEFPPFWGLGGP